jgi:hypothetical protein
VAEQFLDRKSAAAYLSKRGVRMSVSTLEKLAERGPRYAIINGRAVSTQEWLDAWVDAQAQQPASRRGRHTEVAAT